MNTPAPRRELLLGCGNRREKDLSLPGHKEFENLTTVDVDPNCGADVVWDLNDHPLPFEDNSFDEIHAYEVLEHIGRQGDWKGFFEEFSDYWRILKPGGHFMAHTPNDTAPFLWGDPGHTRCINRYSITYLSQSTYEEQVGKTMIADYRSVYKANFSPVFLNIKKDMFWFVLKAEKGEEAPDRCVQIPDDQ
jgi:SAM-dependent methyltransferase